MLKIQSPNGCSRVCYQLWPWLCPFSLSLSEMQFDSIFSRKNPFHFPIAISIGISKRSVEYLCTHKTIQIECLKLILPITHSSNECQSIASNELSFSLSLVVTHAFCYYSLLFCAPLTLHITMCRAVYTGNCFVLNLPLLRIWFDFRGMATCSMRILVRLFLHRGDSIKTIFFVH